jgi:hypothetical protein
VCFERDVLEEETVRRVLGGTDQPTLGRQPSPQLGRNRQFGIAAQADDDGETGVGVEEDPVGERVRHPVRSEV